MSDQKSPISRCAVCTRSQPVSGPWWRSAADVSGAAAFLARNGIWAAAVLMPAGFFLSSAGRDVMKPTG